MNSLAIRVALPFALLLGPFAVSMTEAQSLSTVRGTVTNESARPLEQALVSLDPQGANRQVRSDREGRFSFLGVPAGSHTLCVSR